jgi:mannosyl-3-phosphoglycerate phosphatase
MIVLITDLDGTLLDQSAYSADPAGEALRLARELGLPIVFCSSKTRAEIEFWRHRLSNRHPFIAENGGALYVPLGYFPVPFHAPRYKDGYAVIEFGTPYQELVSSLRTASETSGCRVNGFSGMSAEEVSRRYSLPLEQARLAKIREYDEPFEILDPPGEALLAAIEAQGACWTRGGRLHHITGVNNKAHCVSLLVSYYRRVFDPVITIGLGDGMNDADFLKCVDVPIIVRSADSKKLQKAVPRAPITTLPGPAGWNRAILDLLGDLPAESQPEPSAGALWA